MVWLSYAGDRAWAAAVLGDGGKPAAYHLTSVLWHAAAAALLALLALRLFAAARAARHRGRFAAVAAALFYALHPLRVEAGGLGDRPRRHAGDRLPPGGDAGLLAVARPGAIVARPGSRHP